jgi:hypothetical protein
MILNFLFYHLKLDVTDITSNEMDMFPWGLVKLMTSLSGVPYISFLFMMFETGLQREDKIEWDT